MNQYTSHRIWILLAICTLGFILGAHAQTETITTDTVEVIWKKKGFLIISDQDGRRIEFLDPEEESTTYLPPKSKVDFLGFDLGFFNYADGPALGQPPSPDLEIKPFRFTSHVALHMIPVTVRLDRRGHINLKSAITFNWSNFNFKEDIRLIQNSEGLRYEKTGIDYRTNKLTATYLQIPLLLHFNTSPNDKKGLRMSVGGFAGVLIRSKTKQKSDEFGTVKVRDEFGLNRFRYGLTARIDFRWFDFYFNYNLSEVFAGGVPPFETFEAGINLIHF
ncbi:porin family protein [Pontibacter sp. G13]|uniref:porin family protein n=1 Tax=Pontibacter sp. G13 TaxID=3074898 RepID=UPI002889A242|nr:porin family protein [Pontibacter sp. G13]WNJ16154.1 porin family protein [Pontibacter sp. G13]